MFDYKSINMPIDPSTKAVQVMKVVTGDEVVFDNVIQYHNLIVPFNTSLSHIQNLSLLLIKFASTCVLWRLIIGSALKWILCHVDSCLHIQVSTSNLIPFFSYFDWMGCPIGYKSTIDYCIFILFNRYVTSKSRLHDHLLKRSTKVLRT